MAFDKNLFYRYLFSSILLIISMVTLGLVWGHWAYTLNTCPGYNCGCILFGTRYSSGFAGGHVEYCGFVTFVQIPLFIISVVFVFYFGYRTFIKPRKEASRSKRDASRRNPLLSTRQQGKTRGSTVVFDTQPSIPEIDPPSFKSRIALLVTSIIVLICLLTAAILTTSGFYGSCKEYRAVLLSELGVSGNAAQVVGNRMACTAVFDFLDYLQPDRMDPDKPLQYMRKDRINTGVTLYIAKAALFMNAGNWIFISFFHLKSLKLCCKS